MLCTRCLHLWTQESVKHVNVTFSVDCHSGTIFIFKKIRANDTFHCAIASEMALYGEANDRWFITLPHIGAAY